MGYVALRSEPPVTQQRGRTSSACESVCPSTRRLVVRNTSEEAVLRESSEATRSNSLGTLDGASHLSNLDIRAPGHVGKNQSVSTEVTLQEILPKQPSSTYTQTQPRRYATEITTLLGQHGLQRAKGD